MSHLGEKSIISLLLVFAAAGCSEQNEEAPTPKARPVKLVTIEASSNQQDLAFPAVVRSMQSAELAFPLSGEIIEFNIIEGSEVEKGAVIAKLDQRDAKNSLASAQATFNNAESDYKRAVQLVDRGGISRSDLDNRRTQRDIVLVALDQARKNLSDTVLKAPFSGYISRIFVKQFQNVQPQQTIATLQSKQVEAIVNIPGSIIARSPQLEHMNTRVILDAAPEVEIPAMLHESSGEADPSSQTYEVSLTFDPPENLLILPGMTATAKTTLMLTGFRDLVPDGVSVPLSAILAVGDQTYVWLVDTETMMIEKRAVQIGLGLDELVTIVEGISGGETIVAAGVSFLHEGMLVRAWIPE